MATFDAGERCRVLIYKALYPVQLPLGHSKLESTVRYLGIEVDDTLADGNLAKTLRLHEITRAAAFWHHSVGVLPAITCRWDYRKLLPRRTGTLKFSADPTVVAPLWTD